MISHAKIGTDGFSKWICEHSVRVKDIKKFILTLFELE